VPLGELLDRHADGVAGVVEDDGHTAVDGGRHVPRAGDLRRDRGPQALLDLADGEADLAVGPVEHEPPPVARVVQQVHRLERQLEVLQRRDVERRDQGDHVGEVERREHVVVEGRWRVDDDVVEVVAQHLEHA